MADELGRAVLELTTDNSELEAGVDEAKGSAEDVAGSFTNAADLIKSAFAAIGIGMSLKEVLDATIEAERAEMLLANAVRATGMAAGFTAEQLKAQATVMSQATGTSDEAIMDMQRTLLSFRNIHGEVFRGASQLTLDFAAATGRDAADAARTLGMALNDPVNSMGKLKMAGVAVSDQLKAQIEDMVAHGNLVGAQTLLMDQLKMSYGGTAAAARDTLGGAINALKENFGNLFLEQQAAGETLRNFVEIVNTSLPSVAATFAAVFTGIKVAVEGVVSQLFYLGEGLFKLANLDLKGAMESFGQMPSTMEVANQSITAASAAWTATSESIASANMNAQAMAASAPINAGIVNESAAAMQAEFTKASQEKISAGAREFEAMSALGEKNSKEMEARSKRLAEDEKKRNADRVANFSSTLSTLASLSQSSNSTLAGIGKAAAITMAIRDTYVAANKALASAPPPFNYGLAAAVVAAGMANVDRIRGMEHGGRPHAGETIVVGENGPELFTAPRSGHIIPNYDIGGGGVSVTNNIYVDGLDFSSPETAESILAGIGNAARVGTENAIPAANAFRELASVHQGRA